MNTTPSSAPGVGARLARNSFHSASGRIVAMLAWIALTPPLVRALGPEGFGIWSLFFALAGWLSTMDLGFSQVALRFGAAARARDAALETGQYATLAAVGYLTLGVVWLALVLVAREPALDLLRIHGAARPLAAQAFFWGAIVFTVSGLANTTAASLQAWDRFDLANVVSLSTSLGQVASLTIVLIRGGGLVACLVAVAVGWTLAFLIGVVLLARGVPRFRWGSLAGARSRLRESVGFGIPLQASNAVAVGHQLLGKVLMVRLVSLASVVPYELGLRVSSAGFTFAQLALVAILPEASAMHTRSESERLQNLHMRAGRFVTAVAAVISAAMIGSATPLFIAWLGHADANATLALRGLAIASYAAVVGGITGAIGRGVAKIGIELEWSVLAIVIHLGLGLWLVPRMGLTGALIALAVANIVAALWFVTRLRRSLGWPVGRMLWEPFAVPVIAIALGAWLGARIAGAIASPWWALVASAAAASVVSFGFLLAFRHVQWREIVSLVRRAAAA